MNTESGMISGLDNISMPPLQSEDCCVQCNELISSARQLAVPGAVFCDACACAGVDLEGVR